jgi:DNA-binding response OmpR family regulator
MDIQLPDIDGITALARIREDATLDAVPCLAVSASVMPDDQQRVIVSGFDGFIAKPISPKPFIAAVEQALAQGRRKIGSPSGRPPLRGLQRVPACGSDRQLRSDEIRPAGVSSGSSAVVEDR